MREEAFDSASLAKDSPAHFLHPSRFVPRFAPAADYARTSFSPGRPVLEGAVELMRRIRADFKYDTKATAGLDADFGGFRRSAAASARTSRIS